MSMPTSPSQPAPAAEAARAARTKRRRGGRPEVREDLERGCTMSCAATHDERVRVRVRASATAAGLTVSELIRHAALGLRVPTVLVPAEFLRHAMQLAQLADDLRGLAGNNNQLTKTVNTAALVGGGVDPETARAISAQLPVLGAQLGALREQLDAMRETLVRSRFR